MIKFEIISDPICPWCYIAKTWLDRALEAFPEHNFNIQWKPFQLNPEMPSEGMPRLKYLEKKFGGRQRAIDAYKPIVEISLANKINIDFERIKTTPNTLDAQRLIYWAGIEGVQTRIVSGLFKAFFKDGKDIGNQETLIKVAENHGMNHEVVRKLLASAEDRAHIKNLDLSARKSGIKAVPMFIIDRKYAVSGAQKTEFWTGVFSEISQKYKAADTYDL